MTSDAKAVGLAALLTPTGRGAVAVIAARGPAALESVERRFLAANGRSIAQQSLGRILLGRWTDEQGRDEDVVVVRNGPTQLEIHSHGGAAASSRILDALVRQGCRVLDPLVWFHQQYQCPIQRDAAEALTSATTQRTAKVLLDQLNGALRRDLEVVRDNIRAGRLPTAIRDLESLLDHAALGIHLTKPWRVTIAGLPNVGKSSLMNALAGYARSIVYGAPGTTRDVLDTDIAVNGWPVRLSDVAGAHDTSDSLEAAGIELAMRAIATADLLIWVLDPAALRADSRHDVVGAANAQMAAILGEVRIPPIRMVVLNKIDLLKPPALDRCDSATRVSALKGEGMGALLETLVGRLAPSPPERDAAVPFTAKQVELLQRSASAARSSAIDEAINAVNQILGD